MEASQLKQLMECLAYSVVDGRRCEGCGFVQLRPRGLRTNNSSCVSRGRGKRPMAASGGTAVGEEDYNSCLWWCRCWKGPDTANGGTAPRGIVLS